MRMEITQKELAEIKAMKNPFFYKRGYEPLNRLARIRDPRFKGNPPNSEKITCMLPLDAFIDFVDLTEMRVYKIHINKLIYSKSIKNALCPQNVLWVMGLDTTTIQSCKMGYNFNKTTKKEC